MDEVTQSDVEVTEMPNPHAVHPLDIDLVDFVDGTLDASDAQMIENHLDQCLSCRIKRQRISQTPPIDLTVLGDIIGVPAFDRIQVDQVDPSSAATGELWLTTSDDAAMVLITKVRPNGWGLVVVPVVLDIEVADSGTLVLDETASPLGVPIAIYDAMLNSLPTTALHGRIVPSRPNVDLLTVSDADPGVSRGWPLEGPDDPRHEIRQYINDQVVSTDPTAPEPSEEPPESKKGQTLEPLDQGTVDARFQELQQAFLERPDANVEHLPSLLLPHDVPSSWEGVAQIASFNHKVLVVVIEGGLPDDRGQALKMCEHYHGSAIAVHAQAGSRLVNLYTHSVLAGARSIENGAILTEPLFTGPDTEIITEFLDLVISAPKVTKSAVSRVARVDPMDILGSQVEVALAAQVKKGNNAKIPAKKQGLTSIEDLGPALTEALQQLFLGTLSPEVITELADRNEQ